MLNDYLLPYKPTLTHLNPLLPLSPLRNRLVPLDHNVNEEREKLVDELAQNGMVLKQATKLTFGILILHRFVDSLFGRSPCFIADFSYVIQSVSTTAAVQLTFECARRIV